VTRATRRVLILDDAGPVIVLCVNVLQSLGYAVKCANGGEQGLELLRQETFDLVVVDFKMPGMNGFEVFEKARTLRPDMAFLLITGHGTVEIVEEATRRGFQSILLKPFSSGELRGAVERALGGA